MLRFAVKGLFYRSELKLSLTDLMKALRKGLAVGELVSYEVVYGFDSSPMSVIVDLCVLVKDSLLRPRRVLTIAQVTRDEVLHVSHSLEELGLRVVVLDLVRHSFLTNGAVA